MGATMRAGRALAHAPALLPFCGLRRSPSRSRFPQTWPRGPLRPEEVSPQTHAPFEAMSETEGCSANIPSSGSTAAYSIPRGSSSSTRPTSAFSTKSPGTTIGLTSLPPFSGPFRTLARPQTPLPHRCALHLRTRHSPPYRAGPHEAAPAALGRRQEARTRSLGN